MVHPGNVALLMPTKKKIGDRVIKTKQSHRCSQTCGLRMLQKVSDNKNSLFGKVDELNTLYSTGLLEGYTEEILDCFGKFAFHCPTSSFQFIAHKITLRSELAMREKMLEARKLTSPQFGVA